MKHTSMVSEFSLRSFILPGSKYELKQLIMLPAKFNSNLLQLSQNQYKIIYIGAFGTRTF